MSENLLRRKIASVMERLYGRGLISARGGNASCRLDDGTMLITPSGTIDEKTKPSGIVKMRLDGKILSGRNPSIEWMMHAAVYRARKEISAVVHSHPPFTVGLSMAGEFEVVTEEGRMLLGGKIPVVRAPPGSKELADLVSAVSGKAVVLSGHGLVTLGADLEEAEMLAEVVEENSKIRLIRDLVGLSRGKLS